MFFRKPLWILLIIIIVCLALIEITGPPAFSIKKPTPAIPVLAARPAVTATDIPILMYHKVTPNSRHGSLGLRVTPTNFEAQIKFLKNQGYNTISLDNLSDHWTENKSLPPRPVVLTFDDGYEDNYLFAYPILKKYGFTATIFLVCNKINGYNDWETDKTFHPTVKLLSWPQIREMQRYGISFQSHTLNHPSLTLIHVEEARSEIQQSRKQLTTLLGTPVNYISYPHGRSNKNIERSVSEAGYKAAVSTSTGKSNALTNRFKLKRLGIDGRMNLAEFARMLEE